MATKKRKRPRRQTSSRVSTLAAKWLNYLARCELADECCISIEDGLTAGDVRKLCASVLAQDEVKGQR